MGADIPNGRLFQLPAHTVFAATIAALPAFDAQLAGVGDYGTSLTFRMPGLTPGVAWTASVKHLGPSSSSLHFHAEDGIVPADPRVIPGEGVPVILRLLDVISGYLEHLPLQDPALRTED